MAGPLPGPEFIAAASERSRHLGATFTPWPTELLRRAGVPPLEAVVNGHRRWEWRCRKCGRHHQATERRLRAALDAGRTRLVFGVDL